MWFHLDTVFHYFRVRNFKMKRMKLCFSVDADQPNDAIGFFFFSEFEWFVEKKRYLFCNRKCFETKLVFGGMKDEARSEK